MNRYMVFVWGDENGPPLECVAASFRSKKKAIAFAKGEDGAEVAVFDRITGKTVFEGYIPCVYEANAEPLLSPKLWQDAFLRQLAAQAAPEYRYELADNGDTLRVRLPAEFKPWGVI